METDRYMHMHTRTQIKTCVHEHIVGSHYHGNRFFPFLSKDMDSLQAHWSVNNDRTMATSCVRVFK